MAVAADPVNGSESGVMGMALHAVRTVVVIRLIEFVAVNSGNPGPQRGIVESRLAGAILMLTCPRMSDGADII